MDNTHTTVEKQNPQKQFGKRQKSKIGCQKIMLKITLMMKLELMDLVQLYKPSKVAYEIDNLAHEKKKV